MANRMKGRDVVLALAAAAALTFSVVMGQQANRAAETVTLPVVCPSETEGISPMERYRQERESAELRDMAALEALLSSGAADEATRADASQALSALVKTRETRTALEGALLHGDFAPCVATISGGSVTLVLERETLTEEESARILTLVEAHTGLAPGKVQVVCAK